MMTSRLPRKPFQHLADGGAVGGRHQLDGVFRQAGGLQPLDQAGMDGGGRIERIRAAAQDHRIAGLEAERTGIGRHVRSALIDDADDAERRAHALDMQAVRPVPFGDHVADRIAEFGDFANAVGHGADARRIERQPVHEGGGKPGLMAIRDVDGIGVENVLLARKDRLGHGKQRGVLGGGAGDGQRSGGGAGACGLSVPSN